MTMIPKQFIRVWLGPKPIPDMFEGWWQQFKDMHPTFKFITLRDEAETFISPDVMPIWNDVDNYASRSNLLRYAALKTLGGIYIDTDVMPLRPFDDLLLEDTPFAGKRSSVSFENAIIGSPPDHPAWDALFAQLPVWYEETLGRCSAAVRTGPAFLSHAWFGRPDVRHMPIKAFYPFNGFGAPKRDAKMTMFAERTSFHPDAYCAHFSDHRWGGKPR